MKSLKYILFSAILLCALVTSVYAATIKPETQTVKIYFADREMMRLLPVKTQIPKGNAEQTAKRICDEIVKGRDDNPKIRRLFPNIKRGLTVKVKDRCAYVDIDKTAREQIDKSRDIEVLTVYQIVNSLTEIDGIDTVRFTIGGKVERRFMGYLDMRETFVQDLFV